MLFSVLIVRLNELTCCVQYDYVG